MTTSPTDFRGAICRADLPALLWAAGLDRLPAGMTEDDLRDELIAEEVRRQRESLPAYHPCALPVGDEEVAR